MVIAIIALSIICLIALIHILRYFKVCKLGFHDKVEVERINATALFDKIASEMGKGFYYHNKSQVYNIYGDYPTFRNMACIKCGECFNYIDKETERIERHIKALDIKNKEDEKRKQIATDLYNENCREN